jgi:hypothetical protein
MAFFSKSKSATPPTPALCDRCRLRSGVGRLSKTVPPDAVAGGPAFRDLWICSECAAEIGGEAGRN